MKNDNDLKLPQLMQKLTKLTKIDVTKLHDEVRS